MKDTFLDLLKRIAALKRAPKTSRAQYPAATAPYKPILLLTVLHRLRQGCAPYSENRIEYDSCVRDFGTLYARLFGPDDDTETKVVQAFWYLGTGQPHVWDLHPQPGKKEELCALIDARAQIKTVRKLTSLVRFASFAPADLALLTDADVQDVLISYLIAEHFSDVRRELDKL